MSVSFNNNNTIFGSIRPKVLEQIEAREKIVGKDTERTDDEIKYLTSKTGWIKMSSGVDILEKTPASVELIPSSDLASNHVLFGGTFNSGEGKIRQGLLAGTSGLGDKSITDSYTFTDQYGFKPMAGITSANIKTIGNWGTITKATVNFRVNDLSQLNTFEKLFLLPGFSILLEWGHSLILNPKTLTVSPTISTQPDFFKNPTDKNTIDSLNSQIHEAQLEKNYKEESRLIRQLNDLESNTVATHFNSSLKKLTEDQHLNYDSLFGKISNFSWTFSNDGTYECSVDITGYGEVVESISAAFTPLPENAGEADTETSARELNEFIKLLDYANRFNFFHKNLPPDEAFDTSEIRNTANLIRGKDLGGVGSDPIRDRFENRGKIMNLHRVNSNMLQLGTLAAKNKNIKIARDTGQDVDKLLQGSSELRQNAADIVSERIQYLYERVGNYFQLYVDNTSENDTMGFISMGRLLHLINKFFVPKDKDNQIIKFYEGAHGFRTLQNRRKEKNQNNEDVTTANITPFLTYADHISIDVTTCFLPKTSVASSTSKIAKEYGVETNSAGSIFAYNFASNPDLKKRNQNTPANLTTAGEGKVGDRGHANIQGDFNDILNIQLNIKYLLDTYQELFETDDRNEDILIWDFIKKILKRIERCTGQINNFGLHQEDQIVYVVDRALTPSGKDVTAELNLVGKKSIYSNIQLKSEITSNLSSMIAVSAAGGGSDVNYGNFAFISFFKNFKDRFYSTRSVSGKDLNELKEDREKQFRIAYEVIQEYVEGVNRGFIPEISKERLESAASNMFKFFLQKTVADKKTSPPGIIPLSLSFDLEGIAGIRISETFKVSPGILPERYDESIGFTINSLENTIEGNKWTTKIGSQMIILEEDETPVYKINTDDLPELIPQSDYELINNNEDINQPGMPNATALRNAIDQYDWVSEKVKPEFNTEERRNNNTFGELSSSGRDITTTTSQWAIAFISGLNTKIKQNPEVFKGVKLRFTGGNDYFHLFKPVTPKTTRHRFGKGLDFALDPAVTFSQAQEKYNWKAIEFYISLAAENAAKKFGFTRYNSYKPNYKGKTIQNTIPENRSAQFKLINEYRSMSAHAEGAHFHFGLPG